MIPMFRFGLFDVDSAVPGIIAKIFGPSSQVSTLANIQGVGEFLDDVGFLTWKVLIASFWAVRDPTFSEETQLSTYLKITTFHLIVIGGQPGNLSELFDCKENVHVIDSTETRSLYELEHHFHGVKSLLESYWLHAKGTDILNLYEHIYIEESNYNKRIRSFLNSLIKINEAEGIAVFLMQTGGKHFAQDESAGTTVFEPVSNLSALKFLEFGDTCVTEIVNPRTLEQVLSNDSIDKVRNELMIISTFKLEGIPGFIVYVFDSPANPPLIRILCGISSREIFHLYRARQIRSQYDTLKAISEIGGLEADKREVLYKILMKLKGHFEADGVAIVELVFDQNNVPRFEKTFIERANKGTTSFPFKGFAEHSVANNKALIITNTEIVENRPYGIGFEYDPDRMGIDQSKPVRIESLRAPHAFEDEQSLMYFPFRYHNLAGAIKVSNFTNPNAFHLEQLRALRVYADPVASLLGNLDSIAKLKQEIEQKSSQEEMLDIAEVLFFYREITLGIFHQVGNHLDTIQSEMLMLEFLSNRAEKTIELAEHLSEAKVQIRLAKDLIGKAHQRGLSLNPIEQTCELLRDVIRPALDYARKRTKGTNIEIKHSLSSDEYPTRLDIDLAKESFINLLNNSIWAVKSNRTSKKEIFVAVRKTTDGEYARIEIDDTGIGIQPENYKKLFTPGFTTRPGGTGLGLYFTRKLLEHFGGTVEVLKSNPGKGTTVVVTIKLTREVR